MDHQETIWMKKEETDIFHDDPGLMFLQDPLQTEVPGLSIKPDPELKLCMDSCETNFVSDPLGISSTNNFIKEDPGLSFKVGETVVTSTVGASNNTRLRQNSGDNCGISLEETPKLEAVHNELEISTEGSTYSTMFDTHTQRRGEEEEEEEEEEEGLLFTTLKCSRRENEFNNFRCNFCLQSFASKYRITMHVFIHMDGLQPPTYICKSCGEVFPSDISLNKHLKVSKEDQASSAVQMDQFDSIYRDGSLFLDTEQQSSSQTKTQAFPATGTRAFKCDVCGKSFTRMCNLKSHALIHTGQKPHKCIVCGRSFTHSGTRNKHLLIHTSERPHKCNVCEKSFTQLGSLNNHLLIHTGERPHKCNVCEKSFTQVGSLNKHLLIHTGQRSHKCNVCGKSFTEMRGLKRHALTHTGQRPHKCIECGKSFSLMSTLKTHISIHTGYRPYECGDCEKSFSTLGSLKRHALTHTGPDKCVICGKSFTCSGNLKKHLLTHTIQRPNECNACGK